MIYIVNAVNKTKKNCTAHKSGLHLTKSCGVFLFTLYFVFFTFNLYFSDFASFLHFFGHPLYLISPLPPKKNVLTYYIYIVWVFEIDFLFSAFFFFFLFRSSLALLDLFNVFSKKKKNWDSFIFKITCCQIYLLSNIHISA